VPSGIKLQEGAGGRQRENASDASFPRSNQPRDSAGGGGSRSKFHNPLRVDRVSCDTIDHSINDATRRLSSLYHTCPSNTRSALSRPDSHTP
jgi:hypothetical protein